MIKLQDQQLQQEISAAYLTLVLAHHQIDDLKTAVDSELNQQIPSYKDGVDDARTTYTNISACCSNSRRWSARSRPIPRLPS